MKTCPDCQGTGIEWADEIAIDPCERCKGNGAITSNELIATLRIPRAGMAWVNANTRSHWSTRARQAREWREMTMLQAHRQQFPKGLPYCEIQPTFVFSSKRHRDPGNFVLTTKAIIDALCTGPKPPHGWGSWVDDDPRYLRELMPLLVVEPESPSDGVIIRCYSKDAS